MNIQATSQLATQLDEDDDYLTPTLKVEISGEQSVSEVILSSKSITSRKEADLATLSALPPIFCLLDDVPEDTSQNTRPEKTQRIPVTGKEEFTNAQQFFPQKNEHLPIADNILGVSEQKTSDEIQDNLNDPFEEPGFDFEVNSSGSVAHELQCSASLARFKYPSVWDMKFVPSCEDYQVSLSFGCK
jgi:hypothetical protein